MRRGDGGAGEMWEVSGDRWWWWQWKQDGGIVGILGDEGIVGILGDVIERVMWVF